jgi:hypothetical protein
VTAAAFTDRRPAPSRLLLSSAGKGVRVALRLEGHTLIAAQEAAQYGTSTEKFETHEAEDGASASRSGTAKRAVLNSLVAASFFTPPLLGDKVSGNPAGC